MEERNNSDILNPYKKESERTDKLFYKRREQSSSGSSF